jgi:hypothetical protein
MAERGRDYDGEDRRSKLKVTKEIPLTWLVTFVSGGLANFGCIIWIAATLVSDIGSLKTLVNKHADTLEAIRKIEETRSVQHATHDSRLNTHDQVLVIHGDRITGIEKRLYK